MKEFDLAGFARHLEQLAAGMPVVEAEVLEVIGTRVEQAAKERIGEYHAAAGPYVAWEPLADSTKQDRVRKGYPEDEPGLRSGTMRDSIEHQILGPTVSIGSNDDTLFWFELGTRNMPPRSVIGAAAWQQTPWLMAWCGVRLQTYLSGAR